MKATRVRTAVGIQAGRFRPPPVTPAQVLIISISCIVTAPRATDEQTLNQLTRLLYATVH